MFARLRATAVWTEQIAAITIILAIKAVQLLEDQVYSCKIFLIRLLWLDIPRLIYFRGIFAK